jgi:hypothetical protein
LLPKVELDAALLGWLLEQILQRNLKKFVLNFVSQINKEQCNINYEAVQIAKKSK